MKPVQGIITATALAFALFTSVPALAGDENKDEHGERAEHFSGLPAETDEQARENLREYNAKLKALLNQKKLSASDLGEIHRISYTLENAIAQLDPEVKWIAEYLEEVHLASERADRDTVRKKGRAYLSASQGLLEE